MSGKIVTIAQQKGGSGKTTLAANLALALKAKKKRVALVDIDPQGSLGRWLMTRREALGEAKAGLGFRTASVWGAKFEARDLLKTHDIVIIDTPPKLGYDAKPAFEAADLVIVPVTPSEIDLWATEPTLGMARETGKQLMLVLNRASIRTRLSADMLAKLAAIGPVAKTTIGNRVVFAESMGLGAGVVDAASGLAGEEIRALADEVMKALK